MGISAYVGPFILVNIVMLAMPMLMDIPSAKVGSFI